MAWLGEVSHRFEQITTRSNIQFTQVEGLAIGKNITLGDLKGTLSDFARARAAAGHLDQATAMLDLVLKDNPESFMAQFSYGELHHQAGNAELAIERYRKAIEINPGAAGFLQQRIDKLLNDQLQNNGEEPGS